jgi:glycosyltransferase involved in cell wall biosynthesis
MPLLSIITITYNAELFLEKTLLSVKNQTVNNFEYILIDGGSSDKTLDIAKKYKDLFSTIISEKDNGLYDAMNKGLKLAQGEYVWFMNAGDEIAENEAVGKIEKLALENPDVIYSDTYFMDHDRNIKGLRTEMTPHKLPKELHWSAFKKGMLICHQSFIVKRSLAPYYIKNNLSADVDWEIKCLKQSKKNLPYPGILSKYLEGGLSQKRLLKSWIDRYKVLNTHFGFLENFKNHFSIIFRFIFRK